MNTMHPASPPIPLNPFQGFILGWSRYAEFRGRSSRMEFWSFTVINLFIALALNSILSGIWALVLAGAYQLVLLIPSISVWVRRLHDMGRSGWWVFWAVASYITSPLVAVGQEAGVISEDINPFFISVAIIVVANLIPLLMAFVGSAPDTNQYGPNPHLNPTNPNNPI